MAGPGESGVCNWRINYALNSAKASASEAMNDIADTLRNYTRAAEIVDRRETHLASDYHP